MFDSLEGGRSHRSDIIRATRLRCARALRSNILAVNTEDPYAPDSDDIEPGETAEWIESLDAVVDERGAARGREIMTSLLARSRQRHLNVPQVPTTDYVNTIASDDEPEFPGNEELERSYRRWIRWNAAVTVHRAQRPGIGVGGHISSYA